MLFDHVLPAYLMDMMMWVSGKRPMYVPVLLYFLNTVFLTTSPVNGHACILRQDKKSTRLLPFAWTCNKAAFTGNICMLIYNSFIKFLKFYWLIEIFDLWKWKRVLCFISRMCKLETLSCVFKSWIVTMCQGTYLLCVCILCVHEGHMVLYHYKVTRNRVMFWFGVNTWQVV